MFPNQISWYDSLWRNEALDERESISIFAQWKVLFFYCGNVNLSLQWLSPPLNPKMSTRLSSISLIHSYLVIGMSRGHRKLMKASLWCFFRCCCPGVTKPSPELQGRNDLIRKCMPFNLRMYKKLKDRALKQDQGVVCNNLEDGRTY